MKILLWLGACALAAAAASAQVPGWQHYAGHGFSIDFPQGWKADPAFLDKGYGFFQGASDDVRSGVAFAPTDDLAPGTNLESDQLKLVVQLARPGDLCRAASFLVDVSPDYETRRLIDKPDAVRTFAEPGDQYAIEQAVVIASHAPCIAVHYYIAYARIGPNDPLHRQPFDRDKLYQLLSIIAATVKPGP